MNNDFDDIGKRMPFRETGDYLDNLIDNATEKAITHHATAKRSLHRMLMIASAAAVALLIIGSGIALFNARNTHQVAMTEQGPLDEFLNTLSDEEAAQLTFYELEEIPEY